MVSVNEEDILKDVPSHHYFLARNGVTIKNLQELKTAIEQMDDASFKHHVNEEKNDFSEWIKNIIKDEKLAKNILSTFSKEKMMQIIEKRIKEAENKNSENKIIIPPQKQEEKINEKQPQKVEEALQKEIEIRKREEKIREIEEKIEKKLGEAAQPKSAKFFSKEFIQGMVIGLLLSVVCILIYIKFFA